MASVHIRENNIPIAGFIDDRLIYENLSITQQERSRTVSNIFGVVISGIGKIPFISVNLKLKKLGDFRFALAFGNIFGFWTLSSWSFIKIVDDIYPSLTYEEQLIFKSELSKTKKISCVGLSIFMSIASQTVIAYVAYTYNNNNILMPIAIMLSDTTFPFYSTWLGSKKAFQNHSFSKFEIQLNGIRNRMLELIEGNRNIFTNLPINKKLEFLNNLKSIQSLNSQDNRLSSFLSLLLKDLPNKEVAKTQKYGNLFFSSIVLLSTISHLSLLGIVSYVGGESLTGTKIGGIFFSTATVLSNCYLEGVSNIKTGRRVFNFFYNLFSKSHHPSLSEQFRPKLTFAIKSLGLLISLLSWGPSVQISEDFIQQTGYRLFIQTTTSFAVVLLISTAVLDIVDDIIELNILRNGPQEEKDILEINKKMKRLTQVINESSLLEFAKFIKILPQDFINQILSTYNMKIDELNQYILNNQHNSDDERKKLLVN